MLVEKFKLRMDKASDIPSGSGYGTTDSKAAAETKTPETSGNNTDTPNVDKTKTEGDSGKATTEDKSKQAAAPKEQKKIPDITGYGTDESKKDAGSEGDAGKEADAKAKDDEAKVKDDKPLELDLKGLQEEQVSDLKEFATTLKLSKEQAQALVDKRKESLDKLAKDEQDKKTETENMYKGWEKQLKEDPEFGGEKFAANVHAVNKLLTDFMPDSTKQLTELGRRLSPVQMKEFAKLASKLYGEGEHNAGSGNKGSEERKPWDHYKHNV